MPRYSPERKHAVLAKLLPPHSQPVTLVSRAEGISEQTLYNWLSKARKDEVPVPGSRSKTPYVKIVAQLFRKSTLRRLEQQNATLFTRKKTRCISQITTSA